MSDTTKNILMKRFDLKDSQYEYELKRSIKKNRDITDWLSEKYGVFVNVTDKTLFHFTKKKNLSDIMKYGIIMGDVMTSKTEGCNAPNLTSEGRFHDPSSYLNDLNKSDEFVEKIEKDDPLSYLRLVLKFKEGDNRLVNYRWFDNKFCNGINAKVTDKDKSQYGDLSKQFIFKGVVEPSMIVRVDEWNRELGKFVTLSEDGIRETCDRYEGVAYPSPDHLRISGMKVNDLTGGLKDYYAKTDPINSYRELYKLSDFLVRNLKGRKLKKYRNTILYLTVGGSVDEVSLIGYVVETYNSTVSFRKRVDVNEFASKLYNDLKEGCMKYENALSNNRPLKEVA